VTAEAAERSRWGRWEAKGAARADLCAAVAASPIGGALSVGPVNRLMYRIEWLPPLLDNQQGCIDRRSCIRFGGRNRVASSFYSQQD
jgi:hypothetical protein